MAIFHSLEFDGINSLDNGVFITGEAVYNSPERDVEMIEIPGRDGALVMDKGRYKNVPLSYPAGAFGSDQTEFAQKMRQFRNLMATKYGYKRLVDDYHPDEYRMAVFKDAIAVESVNGKAGEFELLFDCMPQRFLMSGEMPVSVSNGDDLFNPTMNDASPLLEVEGYGTIGFNGFEIEITNSVVGEVEVASAKSFSWLKSAHYIIRTANKLLYNEGDTLTLNDTVFGFRLESYSVESNYRFSTASVTADSNGLFSTEFVNVNAAGYAYFKTSISPLTFIAGTDSTITDTITISATMVDSSVKAFTVTLKVSYEADGSYNQSYVDIELDSTLPETYSERREDGNGGAIIANSTVSILGHPTYIDCDLGEAYMLKSGTPISLNRYIDLGSKLPVLASGSNEFSVDNTVTDLKVIPRWWIV